MLPHNRERNLQIYRLRRRGVKVKTLARLFGLATQNISQIYYKALRHERDWFLNSRSPWVGMLSFRPYWALKCGGIETAEEIMARTDKELLRIRNLGKKSLREIRTFFPYKAPE